MVYDRIIPLLRYLITDALGQLGGRGLHEEANPCCPHLVAWPVNL